MSKSFEDGLLSGGELMARGYTLLAENIGKAIAVLTALLAVLLTFADIGFLGIGTTELTTSLAVMLVSSYVIYFSLEDAGERLGRESEEYKAALDALRSVRSRISADMLPSLRQFCLDYTEAELCYRRRAVLMNGGRDEEEYRAWLTGKKVEGEAVRVFRRVKRLKPIHLSPTALLTLGGTRCDGELSDPTERRTLGLVVRLIPTTICTLFTASMVITAKAGLTPSVIIEGIVKLGCLPIIGLRGYAQGYAYAREALVGWCESKTRLLTSFLERGEHRETDAPLGQEGDIPPCEGEVCE